MSPFKRFVRLLESLAIPNLAIYIVVGQVAALGAFVVGHVSLEPFYLVPNLVLAGPWWQVYRLFTFILIPPAGVGSLGLVFLAFAWYLFWLMSSSLEAHWGVLRFNLFLFVGWALTVAVAFITPQYIAGNGFIAGSVFLAFAYLMPNFEFVLFFILPVKVKWLALLTWLGYAFSFVTGGWPTRLAILAATGNFFIFFARDMWHSLHARQRRVAHQTKQATFRDTPRNVCRICGKNNLTHPDLDFRYCSACDGDQCYCPEHIRNHEHVKDASAHKAD